jgi:hypothetical protein
MQIDNDYEEFEVAILSSRSVRAAIVGADYDRLVSMRVDLAQRIDTLVEELNDILSGFREIGQALQRAGAQEKRGTFAVVQPRLELYATTRHGIRDIIAALEGRERLAHGRPILKGAA